MPSIPAYSDCQVLNVPALLQNSGLYFREESDSLVRIIYDAVDRCRPQGPSPSRHHSSVLYFLSLLATVHTFHLPQVELGTFDTFDSTLWPSLLTSVMAGARWVDSVLALLSMLTPIKGSR